MSTQDELPDRAQIIRRAQYSSLMVAVDVPEQEQGEPCQLVYTQVGNNFYVSIHTAMGQSEDTLGRQLVSVRVPREQARDDIIYLAHKAGDQVEGI